MKLNKSSFLLLVIILSITLTISAQKNLDKPYQKWSKNEAMKVLSDSPWSQIYQSRESVAAASREQDQRAQADTLRSPTLGSSSRFLGTTPVLIRLHSALPVRQAIVRLQQIDSGYDKMDEKKQAEFDEKTKSFLACAICQNYYVVTMVKVVGNTQSVSEGIFQNFTLEQLKNNIWLLNEKGERRNLIQFNAPKSSTDTTVFYFPRQGEKGDPFLTSDSKKFELVINSEIFTTRREYATLLPRSFEFNVTKLMVDKNILF